MGAQAENFSNQIVDAVQIIVDQALNQAKFDKTIQATVVERVDAGSGKYKIKYKGASFYAYAADIDKTYNKNTEVYVLVSEGDMSKDKVILGTAKNIGVTPSTTTAIPESARYEIIGGDCYTDDGSIGLWSYDCHFNALVTNEYFTSKLMSYTDRTDKENAIFTNVLGVTNQTQLIDSLEMADYIGIKVNIKTNLPEAQRMGVYGIDLVLRYKNLTNSEKGYKLKTLRFSSDKLSGNPYILSGETAQTIYFQIKDADNTEIPIGIEAFYVFAEGFTAAYNGDRPEDGTIVPDIIFSNIELFCANRLNEVDTGAYYLTLKTELGISFPATKTSEPLSIEAGIYKGGFEISNYNDAKLYWFRRNARVKPGNEKYSNYGGNGWECLNEWVDDVISATGDVVTAGYWKPAEKKIFIYQSEMLEKKRFYKCVAVYDSVAIEKQVIIKNYNFQYDVSLSTNTGETAFYQDEGDFEIIVKLTNTASEPEIEVPVPDDGQMTNFKAYWTVTGFNGITSLLSDEDFRLQYSVQDITHSSTFTATIFSIDDEYVGSEEITISNTGIDLNIPRYELIIKNRTQVFQYNEAGLSPAAQSREKPITIEPLILSIFDNKEGKEYTMTEISTDYVNYTVPNKKTMIVPKMTSTPLSQGNEDLYSFTNAYADFTFGILDRYNASNLNNTIRVEVKYQDTVLVGYSDFVFVKQGMDGTNGTEYVCRIVPNLAEGDNSYVEWPTWIYSTADEDPGYFNFDYTGDPFKVKLWENETLISSDSYSVEFSAPAVKYTSKAYETSLLNASSSPMTGWAGDWTAATTILNKNAPVVASILKAKVVYSGSILEDRTHFYATLPIVQIYTEAPSNEFKIEVRGGYPSVMFETNGERGAYSSAADPFEIVITDLTLNKVVNATEYKWSIIDNVYTTKDGKTQWYTGGLLKQASEVNVASRNYNVLPARNYDGMSNSIGLRCDVTIGKYTAKIFVPIDFYLNRFGNSAINDWDGSSISINEEEGVILSPQVGAGSKDANNTFTGVVMGTENNGGVTNTGLIGYSHGIRSMFLDAATGAATFGLKGSSGSISITPSFEVGGDGTVTSTGEALIQGNGMEINFGTEPHIKWANKAFSVDSAGRLNATGAEISGNVTITGNFKSAGEIFRVKTESDSANSDEISYGAGIVFNPSSNVAYIKGYRGNNRQMEIDLLEPKISFNGATEGSSDSDSETFYGYISPTGFRFGNKNVETDADGNVTKGGYIQFSGGSLYISGSLTAATGNIGGWSIGADSIYSGKADVGQIRLFSGSIVVDPETNKEVRQYPYIYGRGEKNVICSVSVKQEDNNGIRFPKGTSGLYRGGIYFHGTAKSEDDIKNGSFGNDWWGRIITSTSSTTGQQYLAISSSYGRDMKFFIENVPDEDGKDSTDKTIVTIKYGTPWADNVGSGSQKMLQIGHTTDEETRKRLTTLYPFQISTGNVKIQQHPTNTKLQLNTKAKDLIGAINEIYPGGPVTVQHAVVVLPTNELDIVYDYTEVLHTHQVRTGYGPRQNVIYVQGYKCFCSPATGVYASGSYIREDLNGDGVDDSITVTDRPISYLLSKYPQIELYKSFSGTIWAWVNEGQNSEGQYYARFQEINGFNVIFFFSPQQKEEDKAEDWYTLRDAGGRLLGWTSQTSQDPENLPGLISQNSNRLVFSREYFYSYTGSSDVGFAFQVNKIYNPLYKSEYNSLGFGYVDAKIYGTMSRVSRIALNDINYYYESSGIGYNSLGHLYATLTAKVRIPFGSQAEYEAAVNLLSVDQKLYEIQQNKTSL